MPEGYYIQWLLMFNPYSASNWSKARFFDNPDKNTLAMTTTYCCNEFLSASGVGHPADLVFESVIDFSGLPEEYARKVLDEWEKSKPETFLTAQTKNGATLSKLDVEKIFVHML